MTDIYFLFPPLLVVCYGIYIHKRINKVGELRADIIKRCSAWAREKAMERHSKAFYQYYMLPSYNKMVYSFKPIVAESYLDPKQLSELGYIDKDEYEMEQIIKHAKELI